MSDTKTTATHTPGPWIVFEHVDHSGLIVGPAYTEPSLLGNCREVCTFRGTDNPRYSGDTFMGGEVNDLQRANARLIAASPNLLASCKELRDTLAAAFRALEQSATTWELFIAECEKAGIGNGIGVRADAAIAKAEGGAA